MIVPSAAPTAGSVARTVAADCSDSIRAPQGSTVRTLVKVAYEMQIKRVAQRKEPAVTDAGASRHYGRQSSSPAVREAFDPGPAGRSWSATRTKRRCGGMLRCPTASRGTEEKAA
ncbi:hypothetical protein GCM10010309_19350 [Streptomyces violaceochromogenes]|nr:hypothetical protein GCM10010309_19350 [Streptomyces violaceochromogenes]